MGLEKVFSVAASALTAQSARLNVVASNLANADSATGPDGKPYRAKQVMFSTLPLEGDAVAGVRVTGAFQEVLDDPEIAGVVLATPAETHHALARAALRAGKHVVTANKALLARHGVELARVAEEQGVLLNFEAAVAGSYYVKIEPLAASLIVPALMA